MTNRCRIERGQLGAGFVSFQIALLIVMHASSGLAQIPPADEAFQRIEDAAFAIGSVSGLIAADQPQKFLGARSCAAAACHGGVDPDPRFPRSRRNEYVHWLDRDPHARGYQTLHSELSKTILARLSPSVRDDTSRAKQLANCFSCHNPQPEPSRQASTFYARDAVSCEICHGPAEQWIGPHVTESWPRLKQTGEAETLGFVDTQEIVIRAQTCAACHVGSPGREVNHDLIAAGHPALKFELTAYYAMLPKHWRDGQERQVNPQLEQELWQAGQVACGEAAIKLLAWRAKRAAEEHADAVWPEFAEYDCYACHHELVHPSWRQRESASNASLGMPAWGSWTFSRLKQPAGESLTRLASQMQRGFRPAPEAIADSAAAVRLGAPRIDATVGLPENWDDATQQYLALVARAQAQRDARGGELMDAIQTLREQLAFPSGYDSPKGLFETSGTRVTRDHLHQSLLDLMNQLQRGVTK